MHRKIWQWNVGGTYNAHRRPRDKYGFAITLLPNESWP